MTQSTRGLSKQHRARLEGDLYEVSTAGNGWRVPGKQARIAAMLLSVLKTNGDVAEGE